VKEMEEFMREWKRERYLKRSLLNSFEKGVLNPKMENLTQKCFNELMNF